MPEPFGVLRRRLEEEFRDHADEGIREYVRVLRLLERHSLEALTKAVEEGLRLRTHRREAIAQYLTPAESWAASTFTLDGRDHLRQVRVFANDPKVYGCLQMIGGAQA